MLRYYWNIWWSDIWLTAEPSCPRILYLVRFCPFRSWKPFQDWDDSYLLLRSPGGAEQEHKVFSGPLCIPQNQQQITQFGSSLYCVLSLSSYKARSERDDLVFCTWRCVLCYLMNFTWRVQVVLLEFAWLGNYRCRIFTLHNSLS